MRGKKADKEFISRFIKGCVDIGLETTEQIVAYARKEIASIDSEIQAINEKKVRRSGLLDVIIAFETEAKSKTEEAKLLPFFNLGYPNICRTLCEAIKEQPLYADVAAGPEITFSIKQLLEYKIITRQGKDIGPGENFDEYMKFVLREE